MNKLPFVVTLILSLSFLSMDVAKLSKRKIYDGVTVVMPEDFVVMSDRDIAQRYPSTKKPLVVYMSSDTKADFSMNNTKAKFAGQDAKMLHEIYRATIMELYDTTSVKKQDDPFSNDRVKKSFTFLSEGVKTINKKEYAYFEFTSEFNNIKKYNYLMYTPHKKNILIFNFTCDVRAMNVYQSIANEMMKSIKVNPKMTLPEYSPTNTPGPRKKQTAQDLLEMQKKNKEKTTK